MKGIYFDPPAQWARTSIKALVDGPDNGVWGDEPGVGEVDVVCARVADFDWEHLSVNLSNPTIRSVKRNQFRRLALSNGDLLIEKSGGGEKTPVGRVVAFLGDIDAITSNFVARMRPKSGTSPDFLKYLFAAHYLSGFTYQFIKQATGIQNLDDKPLMQVVTWVPDLEGQAAIARFLNRETALIDGLIEKKTRFIELLKEKRAAVITHAVTKGIDPNAPMKDSGVDWLGRVPAHWQVIAAARLFVERDERSKTGNEELLTVSHLTGVTRRSEKTVNMIEAESTVGYKRCLPGDLVVNTLWAWMGAMGTAPILGIASPAYNVYTPKTHLIDPRYIDRLVRLPSFAKEVTRFSKGVWSSRLRLYPEGLREVRFPVPSLEEQSIIADHLDTETARIDGLIALTGRSINLLQEKRGALITAAVTGKIDVRAAA